MEELYSVMVSGHASCLDVELLISHYITGSLDECYNGFTPLSLACKLNRVDLVSVLLRKGANPNTPSYYLGKYPLHFACDHSDGNLDIVKQLLGDGAEVSTDLY